MTERHNEPQPDRRPSGGQWPTARSTGTGQSPGGTNGKSSGGKTPGGSGGWTPGSWTPGTGWQTPGGAGGSPGLICKVPGQGWKLPGMAGKTPGTGWQTPGTGWQTPGTGWQTPGTGWKTPGTGWQIPGTGWQTPGTGWKTPGTGGQTPGTGWKAPGGMMPMLSPQMMWSVLQMLENSCPTMSVMMSLITEALKNSSLQNLTEIRTLSEAFGAHLQAMMAAAGSLRRLFSGDRGEDLMTVLLEQLAALHPTYQELLRDWQELARNQTARRYSTVRAMAQLMEMIQQQHQQLMAALGPLMMMGGTGSR